MRAYHQCGHNFVWNLDSFREDGAGDGLILSPVNVEMEKLTQRFDDGVRVQSIFDPQFYLPHDPKKHLATYPFHPANRVESFSTTEFAKHAADVAKACVEFQADLGFAYVTIPTRYFDELPEDYLEQVSKLFRDPFVEAWGARSGASPLLLSVVAKPSHVKDQNAREELLTWVTAVADIRAIYLILENSFTSKQIKDPEYLAGVLSIIHDLREAGMEVHVGYANVEGLLYAGAGATSVSMGSFENLRSFGTLRLETHEKTGRRGPRARVYSGRLLQWVEDQALPAMKRLVPDWEGYFDPSPYRDEILAAYDKLYFNHGNLYKHHFAVFSKQVGGLSGNAQENRTVLRGMIDGALDLFQAIAEAGVRLDGDSDGSHLLAWHNALAMHEADLKDNE